MNKNLLMRDAIFAGKRLRSTAPVDDDFPELMHDFDGALRAAFSLVDAQPVEAFFDLFSHLINQKKFSENTFGPGMRTQGICDHITKELEEIKQQPNSAEEWIDVVILGLDGAWRTGATPAEIISALCMKQAKNELRDWPDWRTAPADKAIEHIR